ncbi:MAG TPA: ThuA domain-containing protein [Sphingomonas sp.]|nr:ThuA domain-containing protein [Sphingomonas sp.]
MRIIAGRPGVAGLLIARAGVVRGTAALLIALLPVWFATSLHAGQPAVEPAVHGRKIVFLASPKEHGQPGRHEYEKDLRELAWSLEHASNVKDITTQVIVGRTPKDLSIFEDAAVIVIEGNGDWRKQETGTLFPQFEDTDGRTYDPETTDYLAKLDALIKRKNIGIVVYHYSMWVDNWAGRSYFLNWLGGLWIPHASNNPVDTWSIRPIASSHHPVLRGVNPWKFREEIFSHFFVFENPRRTELLEATPTKSSIGGTVPVSWAYQRADGGRSLVWGGSDFHDNMHLVPDYRRYLLNGIVWAAGIEVPAGGVKAPPPPEL